MSGVDSGMSLISIVIPCWNAQDTVGDAIESAIAQRRSGVEVEIIVVDDGSTDNSLEVIRSFGHEIRCIARSHLGACAARNAGLVNASGEILQFLDADDFLMEGKVARQAQLLAESGVTFVAGSFYRENSSSGARKCKKLQYQDPWVALLSGGGSLGITSSNLWRASAIKSIGGWNIEWQSSQEAELMFRLLQYGAEVVWDIEPLTIIRAQEESISHTVGMLCKPSAWKTWVKVREDIVEELAAGGQLTEERLVAFQETIIKLARLYYRQDNEEAIDAVSRNLEYLTPLRFRGTHCLYRRLFNLLGFERAEQLRALYGSARRRLYS